jgi:hypothetical protein
MSKARHTPCHYFRLREGPLGLATARIIQIRSASPPSDTSSSRHKAMSSAGLCEGKACPWKVARHRDLAGGLAPARPMLDSEVNFQQTLFRYCRSCDQTH